MCLCQGSAVDRKARYGAHLRTVAAPQQANKRRKMATGWWRHPGVLLALHQDGAESSPSGSRGLSYLTSRPGPESGAYAASVHPCKRNVGRPKQNGPKGAV
jgi:hypothetical protein